MEEKLFYYYYFFFLQEKAFLLSAFLVRDRDRKQKEDRQEVASCAAVTAELKEDLLLMPKAVRKTKQTNKNTLNWSFLTRISTRLARINLLASYLASCYAL